MKIVVIDGQGGRIGKLFISKLKETDLKYHITAIGTNAIATSAMLKAGADVGATGENSVIVACRKADVIVGPMAILTADSLCGEVTPNMALAVGQSHALRLLIPVNQHCNNVLVGMPDMGFAEVAQKAVEWLLENRI